MRFLIASFCFITISAHAMHAPDRILKIIHKNMHQYGNIDGEIVHLFKQYKTDNHLIHALLPMAQDSYIGGRIDVKKLDEKRALSDGDLQREMNKMLQIINDYLGFFLTKNTAKRLLVKYLAGGLYKNEL